MRVREIPGAYVGRHVEVVDGQGVRVWPTPERSKRWSVNPDVILGCSRDECEGFIAGYTLARKTRAA